MGRYKAKQFVDIEFATSIVEFREHEGVCECCNQPVRNSVPLNDLITYGNNLKSFSAMLSLEGMVSINRIKQIISELSDGQLNLSEGTISKWNKALSVYVEPAIAAIKEKLLTAPVNHKDETGIRINKTLHWLHVLGNKQHTLYHAHKKRGSEADKAVGILPAYSGVLVHDHLRGLYDFLCTHAECNAHILRYLKAAIEKKKRVWAEDMIKLLLEAKTAVEGSDKPPHSATVRKFHRRYDEILKQGREEFLKNEAPDYNGEDMKLLRRMKKYKAEHLRFVSDPRVPFDNNQAERDLRMIKAKSKISGCFRAPDGGEVFATLKSYTSTLRKNGRNIFDGIRVAFAGVPVVNFAPEG
jgi:transposase